MNFNIFAKCGASTVWQYAVFGKYKTPTIGIIMRLIVFLTLAFTLHISANATAQRVSLSVRNQPLKSVLKDLRKQSGYSFIYSDRDLKHARPVNLQVAEKDILAVLPDVFRDQPLTYAIDGKLISVRPKRMAIWG